MGRVFAVCSTVVPPSAGVFPAVQQHDRDVLQGRLALRVGVGHAQVQVSAAHARADQCCQLQGVRDNAVRLRLFLSLLYKTLPVINIFFGDFK